VGEIAGPEIYRFDFGAVSFSLGDSIANLTFFAS